MSVLARSERRISAMVGDGPDVINVELIDRDAENRMRCLWSIWQNGALLETGADLRSGCHAETDAEEMLCTLLAFLGAAAEAYGHDDSENADLFAPATMAWAYEWSGELTDLGYELEQS